MKNGNQTSESSLPEGYLVYKPSKTAKLFHADDSHIRGVMGPVGSGKSVMCLMEVFFRACKHPPDKNGVRRSRAAITRGTEKQLRDTTMKTVFEWFPKGVAGRYVERDVTFWLGAFDDGTPGRIVLPDGTKVLCEMVFRAIDREDQVRNLLSLELSFAWINEFKEFNFSVFKDLFSRVGRFNKGGAWSGVFMDTNPYSIESEWAKFFDEYEYHFDAGDFPRPVLYEQPGGLDKDAENIENLTGGRNYYLRMMGTTTDKEWINVYVHGKRGTRSSGKPVYGSVFSRDTHVTELAPLRGVPIGIGMDFGTTPAAVFCQQDKNGRWYVIDEIVTENAGALQFARIILSKLEQRYPGYDFFAYGDPAGNQKSQIDLRSVFDVLEAQGISVRPSVKGVQPRIDSVRDVLSRLILGEPAMLIDTRCVRLIKGFMGGYRYSAKASKNGLPVPEKNEYSHIHDALQYIIAPFIWPTLNRHAPPAWEADNHQVKTEYVGIPPGADFDMWSV